MPKKTKRQLQASAARALGVKKHQEMSVSSDTSSGAPTTSAIVHTSSSIAISPLYSTPSTSYETTSLSNSSPTITTNIPSTSSVLMSTPLVSEHSSNEEDEESDDVTEESRSEDDEIDLRSKEEKNDFCHDWLVSLDKDDKRSLGVLLCINGRCPTCSNISWQE